MTNIVDTEVLAARERFNLAMLLLAAGVIVALLVSRRRRRRRFLGASKRGI